MNERIQIETLAMTRRLFAAALAASVVGCGGGASAPAPAPPPPPPNLAPSGLYVGTMTRTTNGVVVTNPLQALATDDGHLWLLYTRTFAGVLMLDGFIECDVVYGAGTVQSSDLADPNNGIGPGSLDGTFAPDGSIKLQGTDPVRVIDFQAQRAATATYDPAATASLADVAGNWTVTAVNGLPSKLAVAADGSMTGLLNGSPLSGALVPRAGLNVFDVQAVINDPFSMLNGITFTGVAFLSALPDGRTQFIWAGVSSDRQFFEGMLGVR